MSDKLITRTYVVHTANTDYLEATATMMGTSISEALRAILDDHQAHRQMLSEPIKPAPIFFGPRVSDETQLDKSNAS